MALESGNRPTDTDIEEDAPEDVMDIEALDIKTEKPVEEAPEGVIDIEKPISTENPSLDPETKQQVADAGIGLMREIFRGIPDYAVFASGALYLQGKEKGIDELAVAPGDFDAVVGSDATLNEIKKRLEMVAGVTFENDGDYIPVDQGKSKKLKGVITMEMDSADLGRRQFEFPFEVFTTGRIIDQEMLREREKVGGMNVLTLEATKRQYQRNLEFESRVKVSVDSLVKAMQEPLMKERVQKALERWKVTAKAGEPYVPEEGFDLLVELTNELKMSPQELLMLYETVEAIEGEKDEKEREPMVSHLSELASGEKTKVEKRVQKLEKLTRLGAISVGKEKEETGEEELEEAA